MLVYRGGLPGDQDPPPTTIDNHHLAGGHLIEDAEPVLAGIGCGDSFHMYNVLVDNGIAQDGAAPEPYCLTMVEEGPTLALPRPTQVL